LRYKKTLCSPEVTETFLLAHIHTHSDLPVYRRVDVQKEARENKKVWVTYGDSVYDLTAFARSHPGGSEKLLMASGGPIEPFWEMYPFHKSEIVYKLLEKYKIGKLHPDDVLSLKDLPDFSEVQT
jgi:sulfite oxidase